MYFDRCMLCPVGMSAANRALAFTDGLLVAALPHISSVAFCASSAVLFLRIADLLPVHSKGQGRHAVLLGLFVSCRAAVLVSWDLCPFVRLPGNKHSIVCSRLMYCTVCDRVVLAGVCGGLALAGTCVMLTVVLLCGQVAVS